MPVCLKGSFFCLKGPFSAAIFRIEAIDRFQVFLAGRRKGGVAFPDQVVAGVNGRIEGTEGDGRIDGRRQEIADREDQARRVEGERDRRAVQNVVGGDDVQLVRIGLGPIEEHLPDPFSLGDDQGAAAEVFWRDGRLLDQGIVVFHEQAPIRGVGQGMGVVSALFGRSRRTMNPNCRDRVVR